MNKLLSIQTMKEFVKISIVASLLIALASCGRNKNDFDASGSFEADEVIVSAEQSGKITRLNIEEGQLLQPNAIIGDIDVSNLQVQKEQANASVQAISEKVNSADPQVAVLQSQIHAQQTKIQTLEQQLLVLNKEVNRTQKLLAADAATPKQLDDLLGQKSVLQKEIATAIQYIDVLQTQIGAARSNVQIQNRGILSELDPSKKKLDILDEQIGRGLIKNPFAGTVLTKYAMAGEYATIGKPLYKIADLGNITLRVYITGDQLPGVKLNQPVTVHTDDGNGGFHTGKGVINWISDKAEFTPKTIQTKNERANLVYAIKVKMQNDGRYKIGMYGEIKFNSHE
jgi:HlyD family secretion protein